MTSSETEFWSWDLSIVLSAIAAVIALFTYLQTAFFNNKETVIHTIKLVEERQGLLLYRSYIINFLNILDKWFGSSLSFQSFSMCYSMAIGYSVLFFIAAFSWGGGTQELAGVTVFEENLPYREWYLPLVLIYFISLNYFLKYLITNSKDTFIFSTPKWVDSRDAYRASELYIGKSALIITVYIAATLNISVAFAIVASIAFMAVFFSVGSDGIGIVFSTIIISSGILLAVVNVYQENYVLSIHLAIFILVFPLFNALLDWLSWWFSRFFLTRASKENSTFLIAFDIFIDLIAAIAFMLLLCILLPIGIEIINRFYLQYAPEVLFNWRELALVTKNDPFGKGLMITLMIITTMIPTFIHVVLGLIAVILQSFMGKVFLIQLKKYRISQSNIHLANASGILTIYLVGVAAALVALYQFLMWVLGLNIADLVYKISMSGANLLEL